LRETRKKEDTVHNRRHFLHMSATGALVCALGALARAANAQTVAGGARLIVGFPAGGSLDVVARLLIEQIKGYAPSIIVDNRPGAGGRIALEALKAGEPDGSVFALTPGDQITLFPHVYQRLKYDAPADFAPVTMVCRFPFLLAIGPLVPASVTTLAQFIAWCRTNPNLATYGSPGAGTRPHFLGVSLARAAGFEFVHLPYKGSGPAIQDLLSGQIPANISVLSNALPHVQSGALRALAVTAPSRSPLLPHVPTAREAGYPDIEAIEWFGLFAPARTPVGTIDALHAAVRQALATDAVRSGLARLSFEVAGGTRGEFADLIQADTQRWAAVVKASGFRPID
jgi:tripartite-type tricarboxylate transporter receptor subunit TctC